MWPCLYLVHLITNFYLNVSSEYLFLIFSIITVASVLFNCRICCVYIMKNHSEIFGCFNRTQNLILLNCSIKSGCNLELRRFTTKLLVWVVSNISRNLFHFVTILSQLKEVPWVIHLHISLKDDIHSSPGYFLMFASSFVAILFTLMLVVRTTWLKQVVDSRRHKWTCNK